MHPIRLLARRGVVLASTSVTAAILAFGIVACTNIGVGTAAAAASGHASKSAFCSANDAIDKASVSVTTGAGFLALLKSHTSQLKAMQANAPSGSLGQLVQQLVKDAEKAVSANSLNDLNSLPNGAGIDTYCGVDGAGQPLPAYWNTGKNTAFCATFLPLFQAVGNATSEAGVLSVLTAHKAQINTLAAGLAKLPSSIKATATSTVDNAQKAISAKNAALLNGNGNGPATRLALYCGQNQ